MDMNNPKNQGKEDQENINTDNLNPSEEIHIAPSTINNENEDDDADMENDTEEIGMEWDDDRDEMEEYGSSTEKYGGYNGWSDDAIDDAFEGDPMNTWNVD